MLTVRFRLYRLRLERRYLHLKIRYLEWKKARLIRKAWPYELQER